MPPRDGDGFLAECGSEDDGQMRAAMELTFTITPPPLPMPAAAAVRSSYPGPRGFFWVLPGQLGGLPRPGIVGAVEPNKQTLTFRVRFRYGP